MSVSGGLLAQKETKEVEFSAVLIKADGTKINLGQIAYWHKNPFKRLWGNLMLKLREKRET